MWYYDNDTEKQNYIPYIECKYGYNYRFLNTNHFKITSVANVESRISSSKYLSGVAAKAVLTFQYVHESKRFQSIELETEGYSFISFNAVPVDYYQIGINCNFKHVTYLFQFNKPIKKDLYNPLLKNDDMDVLFVEGLIVYF